MNAALLPTHVSPNMASALAGLSSRAIRRMLGAGLLPSEGGTWQRIPLTAVEELIGKPITPEIYLAADRQLDRARGKAAAYNQTRPSPITRTTTPSTQSRREVVLQNDCGHVPPQPNGTETTP